MKSIELKVAKENIGGRDTFLTTYDLLKSAINNPTQGGFNVDEMIKRLRLLGEVEKHKELFEINAEEFKDEFLTNCIRITNEKACHGCWNKPEIKFDKGNWNWCPYNKNFECQTSITAEMVINRISRYF